MSFLFKLDDLRFIITVISNQTYILDTLMEFSDGFEGIEEVGGASRERRIADFTKLGENSFV